MAVERWLYTLPLRLRSMFRRSEVEAELNEELAYHLERQIELNLATGMAPDEARFAARRAFGNVGIHKESARDARHVAFADHLRRDVLYAWRGLRRSPAFALTAVLSLGIAIGANTTVFTVVDALLFRAPPGVTDAGRLADIGRTHNGGGFNPVSFPDYVDIRDHTATLSGVYATSHFPEAVSLMAGADGAERVFCTFVTGNYFSVLGAHAATGRLFVSSDDERDGANRVVVLSHSLWTRRFNQDSSIVGRTVRLNGTPFLVAGVASRDFRGTGVRAPDLWTVVEAAPVLEPRRATVLSDRSDGWLTVGGRLKPSADLRHAAADIAITAHRLEREFPAQHKGTGLRIKAASALGGLATPVRGFLVLLTGIVLSVLGVACINVAGILVARAAARDREFAVRIAMGAGRSVLLRQLFTETAVLFVLGAAAGLVLARGMTSAVIALLPTLPFPVAISLSLDTRVIAFTVGLSAIAALLCGLAPAFGVWPNAIASALKGGTKEGPGRARVRGAFVIAQVALSVVLVIVGALFARALQRAGAIDPGFDPNGVELASIDLSLGGYTDASGPVFRRQLLERVRRLPQVQSATMAAVIPGGFEGIGLGGIKAAGTSAHSQQFIGAEWNVVDSGYFATLRMPLLDGRDFSSADAAATQPVAIIGKKLAQTFWPRTRAIGKYLLHQESSSKPPQLLLVVGVASDPRAGSLIDGTTEMRVYLPVQQNYLQGRTMIVARSADGRRISREIREAVASMNPGLPVIATQAASDYSSTSLLPQRLATTVAGSLGLVGLLLASLGIYGVTAYTTARRTREFGIRAALGAKPWDVLGLVLRQGMSLALLGCVVGMVIATGASQLLTGLLYGVSPIDPVSFGGALLLFVITALLACSGPARRSVRVSPMEALRTD